MKLLNVKSTTLKEVESEWSLKLPNKFINKQLFVRCNSKGDINWDKAPVYSLEELEEIGDYQIIINLNVDEFIENDA